jgi:serine/threonine-protein kinase
VPAAPSSAPPSAQAGAAAAPSLVEPEEGAGPRRIGRYTVVRELGVGGMAEVLLARATGEAGFEKLVALKVLQPHMARQPMVVEHFLDEARLASRLVHPNIVQTIDLGRAGAEYFIAMEYVEGSDLERLLAASRAAGAAVPLRVAFTVVARVLDGLHAAHTASSADGKPLGIVHRDVKAANVFVARNGAVKVGDFGIAKANEDARGARTEVGQVKGTAAYMSPEHRTGEAVDARSDLYSAAAVAYEVFTGREINVDLVRLAHLGRAGWPHLELPSKLRPDLPPEVDAVLMRALAYERADRFPSCAALAEALEEIAARSGIGLSDKAVAQWVEGGSAAGSSVG